MQIERQDNGKWSINDLTAEQTLDIQEMVSVKYGLRKMVENAKRTPSEERRHKKHLHPKICSRCGKSFKGLSGLGTHIGHMHKLLPKIMPDVQVSSTGTPTPTGVTYTS